MSDTVQRERIDRRLEQIGRFLAQAGDNLPPLATDPHKPVALETVAQIRHAAAYLFVIVSQQETRLRALEDWLAEQGREGAR